MSHVVSVLITAHNAGATLARPLRALAAQRLPTDTRLEVVVVDDRSSDNTRRVAQETASPASRVLRIDAHDSRDLTARQAALEVAARASSGALILLLDADAEPPAEWVCDMQRALSESDLVSWPVAFRAAAATTEARVVAALQTADNAFYLGVCHLLALLRLPSGCCFGAAGVRRSLLGKIGGFAALPFTLTEDLAFARATHHAGGRLRVGAGRPVVVSGAATLRDFVARAVRAGSGGGGSVLAAVLGAGVATLPLLVLLAAVGLVSWPVVLLRWAGGVAFVVFRLARGRSLRVAWASLIYEPMAIAVALAVWRKARTTQAVAWGGVLYPREALRWRRSEPA